MTTPTHQPAHQSGQQRHQQSDHHRDGLSPHHQALLEARYGAQPHPDTIVWNPTIEHLLAHKSVRTFLPTPLCEGALQTMVAAAQSASNSSNLNQWSVIAVADPRTREQLAHLASDASGKVATWIAAAPTILLWVVDASRNHATATAAGTDPEVFEYLDSLVMGTVDTALAAQNAVIAAQSLGLGVTFLGSMRNRAGELAELVGLPRYSFVAFGLAVGYPDPEHQTSIRPRPAQDVVLHHERYQQPRAGWLEDYEATYEDFRLTSGMRKLSWAESIQNSVSYAYMDGREHLREVVQERGFGLR